MDAAHWHLGDGWQAHASGLYVPPRAPKRRRPVAIDLFCGAGGFSLGLIQGGFDVIAGADHSPEAMMTYLHNLGAHPVNLVFLDDEARASAEKAIGDQYVRSGWAGRGKGKKPDWTKGKNGLVSEYGWGPLISGSNRARVCPPEFPGVQHFFLGDIRKLTGTQILRTIGMEPGEVDLVVGGPPCQGYSKAGKQNVMDPRNSLVFEFARMVLDIMPKTLVMEEVPDILTMTTSEGLPIVDTLCQILQDGGFGHVDALKRSLLATSGAGAMVRGQARKPKQTKAAPAQPASAQQEVLF